MFLAAGAEKAAVLKRVLEGPLDPEGLPAQFFLRDERLNVNLLMDEPAAAQLSRRE
jgi:6-phosphogluconolactonase/glucosamine-6-phosphate isomerase/deaminase